MVVVEGGGGGSEVVVRLSFVLFQKKGLNAVSRLHIPRGGF